MHINARDLSFSQRQAALFLRDTCEIQRTSETVNARGGVEQSIVSLGIFPCLLALDNQRQTQEERGGAGPMQASQEINRITYRLHVAYDADIRPDDIVIINKARYEVVQVFTRHTDRLTKRANLVKDD